MKKLAPYLFLLLCYTGVSQKYNFVNWTVEDGLIQSQALHICQDKYRQLWISTEGGLCKFDGKKFTGYATQEGLSSNRISALLCDAGGNICAGTEYGLSFFNGRDFKNVALGKNAVNNITHIVQLDDKKIYANNNYRLYVIDNYKSSPVYIEGDSDGVVSALYRTASGTLLAYIHTQGVYALGKAGWKRVAAVTSESSSRFVRDLFVSTAGDTLLASGVGLLQVKNGRVGPSFLEGKIRSDLSVYSITEDAKKNTWLGTDNGAYKVEKGEVTHFNSKNGFTDNTVSDIFRDVENNLWFATDADGIFKFSENTFTYYDKSSGLSNPIIMGIVEAKDKNIYIAGYGGGLYRINTNKEIVRVNLNNTLLEESKISSLYADSEDNIWIGTLGKGVWVFNEKKGLKRIEDKGYPHPLRGGTCFLKDTRGNMLIGNSQGLYLYDKDGKVSRAKFPITVVSSLKQLHEDTILAGTSQGIYIIDRDYKARRVEKKEFEKASMLCLSINNKNVWMGTTDRGLLNWDLRSGKIIKYNTSNGLPSNFIYSIYVSDKQTAWVGTGFGISNLFLKENGDIAAIRNYGRPEGLLGMECNHNSVLRASDSGLWFGTTKGLFHFNPFAGMVENNRPFVILKAVKLFSSPVSDSSSFKETDTWFNIPQQLKLKAGQNHLTFELGAIYFTNPDAILYKYKLEGIDNDFTTSANPLIIYPSLPPGKYTLTVMALTQNGIQSANSINYTFEIDKAFYQTRFFQALAVFFLIAIGALFAYLTARRKQQQKETLEKIREEEFMKLRQRTAEDFHDEVGNKLTRISVLADILKAKMPGNGAETTKIVQQIKENTNALYTGSRDIIWSLNPQNDGVYEITEHIKEIGVSLFHDTETEFNLGHNLSPANPLRLKLDYSRNLIMAFKEIYNNILKHSGANKVEVSVHLTNERELKIEVADNGKGFNMDEVQRGNGLKNIRNRVSRMNSEVQIDSKPGQGTQIKMILKNIFM